MLEQQLFFCGEMKKEVTAIVEKKGSTCSTISCNEMLFCGGTTFCRFANPLSNRTPLQPLEDTTTKA